MADVSALAAVVGAFALLTLFVRGCDAVVRSGADDQNHPTADGPGDPLDAAVAP